MKRLAMTLGRRILHEWREKKSKILSGSRMHRPAMDYGQITTLQAESTLRSQYLTEPTSHSSNTAHRTASAELAVTWLAESCSSQDQQAVLHCLLSLVEGKIQNQNLELIFHLHTTQ